jgi:hypothetical protein
MHSVRSMGIGMWVGNFVVHVTVFSEKYLQRLWDVINESYKVQLVLEKKNDRK